MLTDAHPSRDVDLRPYAGGGISYGSASSRLQSGTLTTTRTSGMGMQAFGGVEMTFKDSDNVAISAEMGYYRQPVRVITSPVADGVTYRVFVHFYLN